MRYNSASKLCIAAARGNSMIYIVSGKGGVGKSTAAAALGLQLAKKGQKTLVVELGGNSYFDLVFDKEINFTPQEVMPHLYLSLWSGEACLREFIAHYIRISAVVDLFFENRIMKTLVKGAPALQELALIGKLTSGPRKIGPALPFDNLVLDAYSSGHFLSLMRVPRAMAETIALGPMGQQSRSIHEVLVDPQKTQLFWVTTAEEMPVQESLEFLEVIEQELGILPKVIVNKTWKALVNERNIEGHSEFSKYLHRRLEFEKWTEEKLSRYQGELISFPWILEADPILRIEALSEVMVGNG